MKVRNVLVTGAAGFIGSHLAERCIELGYKVKALVRYNSRNDWGWLEQSKYKSRIKVISGDIRDFDSVYAAVKGSDTVFHLAALIGIPYSYVSPLAYIRTNVEGTYNVLQAARMLGTGNIIITSTSETYGTAQYVPIDEKHPLVGQSPYAASKISADQLALSFFRSFAMPIKIARPFNTYGPRQSARAVIPTIITQVLGGHNSIKVGNVSPKRDLIFVSDTVNAFVKIAESDKLIGEVINIGNGKEASVEKLIKAILRLAGVEIKIEQQEIRKRPFGSEVEMLLCDNRKITAKTGWRPKFSLEQGLEKTIKWFRENRQLYKEHIYNI